MLTMSIQYRYFKEYYLKFCFDRLTSLSHWKESQYYCTQRYFAKGNANKTVEYFKPIYKSSLISHSDDRHTTLELTGANRISKVHKKLDERMTLFGNVNIGRIPNMQRKCLRTQSIPSYGHPWGQACYEDHFSQVVWVLLSSCTWRLGRRKYHIA